MQTHGCMVCRLTERQLNGQTDPLTDGQTEECRQSHPQVDRQRNGNQEIHGQVLTSNTQTCTYVGKGDRYIHTHTDRQQES